MDGYSTQNKFTRLIQTQIFYTILNDMMFLDDKYVKQENALSLPTLLTNCNKRNHNYNVAATPPAVVLLFMPPCLTNIQECSNYWPLA